MTETTGYQFTHLAPAEAGLGQIFARPKAIAAGCVIIIAGLGWFYLSQVASQKTITCSTGMCSGEGVFNDPTAHQGMEDAMVQGCVPRH